MQVGGNANAVCTPEYLLYTLELGRLGSCCLSFLAHILGIFLFFHSISLFIFLLFLRIPLNADFILHTSWNFSVLV